MIADRPINISEEYRKIALQGEPIFDNSQDIVIISMQNYKTYEELAKAKHNAEYLEMLDRGAVQILGNARPENIEANKCLAG